MRAKNPGAGLLPEPRHRSSRQGSGGRRVGSDRDGDRQDDGAKVGVRDSMPDGLVRMCPTGWWKPEAAKGMEAGLSAAMTFSDAQLTGGSRRLLRPGAGHPSLQRGAVPGLQGQGSRLMFSRDALLRWSEQKVGLVTWVASRASRNATPLDGVCRESPDFSSRLPARTSCATP